MVKSKKKKKSTNRSQVKGSGSLALQIIVVVVIILALFFFGKFLSETFLHMGSFEYKELTFTKEKFGEIPVYKYYYYIDENTKYNLYLRTDPRKNEVPIEGEVLFDGDPPVYVSADAIDLAHCEFSAPGIHHLTAFLIDNRLETKGATPRPAFSGANNLTYADCTTHPDNTVIIIQDGEETKITKPTDSCHVIEINDCEVLEAIEKFELSAVLDAQAN